MATKYYKYSDVSFTGEKLIQDEQKNIICELLTDNQDDINLLLAAPELLETLEGVVKIFGLSELTVKQQLMMRHVKTAIAKARGEA